MHQISFTQHRNISAYLMRKLTSERLFKPFVCKPISGLSKPFAHQKLGSTFL